MAELKELKLKNFKSFKKATIPFKKGFTAIIGPNGSGKSNILDAILFVLGSTSMKSLRAGRISNLINNTASESYGKVEVTIKEKEKTWKISRTIDKKGKSICRINEQKKGLNEVISLLNELGLKSDGNNIVAQGDITKIIEMSPEQRRQIIDDLAGIREFDLKREESEKNLKKASERIKNANLILSERLSRIEGLEEEKRAAEQYLKLEELKNRAKATILKLESEETKKGLLENKAKLKKLKLEADAIDKKIKGLEEKIIKTEKTAQQKERELFEKQEKSFREILSRIESLKGEKNLVLEKIRSEKRRLAENSEREDNLSKKLGELKGESASEKARLEEIAGEKPLLESELKEVERELALLSGSSKEKETETNALENRLADIEEELERKQAHLTELLSEKSGIEKQNSLAEKELREIAIKIKELKPYREKIAKLKEHLEVIESKKTKQSIEFLDKKIEKAVEQEKSFQAKASEIQNSLKELRREIAKCPVCDSKLSVDKKKRLIEKKAAEEKEALFEMKRISREVLGLRKKREELEKEHASMLELRQELAILREKASVLEELEAKQKSLLSSTAETSQISARIERVKKELESLKKERNEVSEKLSSIKTDKKTIELNHKKSELENNLKMLRGEENNIRGKALARIESSIESTVNEIENIHLESTESEKRIESLEREAKAIEEKLEKLEEENQEQRKSLELDREKKDELDKRLTELREKKDSLEVDSKKKAREMEELRIENGKFEVRLSDLEEEFIQFKDFKPLKNFTLKELKKELAETEKKLEKIGPVNLKAAKSLDEEKIELLEVKEKIEKLEEERNAILEMIEKIEVKRKNVFIECFNQIKESFSRMFYNFFDGQGYLSLTDEENPTQAGLLIEAKHKGENLQNIDSMSGGEKTLTALAFIFAIQQYDPAPFYFFDEADAALDEENSIRLTRVISEISKNSQFIAITHNNSLIKSADQIIGVTLGKEKSSVIGLDLKEKILEKNS